MTRITYVILIVITLFSVSCSDKKEKEDKKSIIPEKDLIPLLTDIHLTDGLLAIPKINDWSSAFDTVGPYIQVIQQHGYTKEQFDKTMNYYFADNPKRLIKIYNKVMSVLSGMDSKAEKELHQKLANSSSIWPGKDFYCAPSVTGNDTTLFDINLNKSGFYNLKFSATLYPDDQSVNSRAVLFTCSPDSIGTGSGKYYRSINFLKDGISHNYVIMIPFNITQPVHLRGWLYYFTNNSSDTFRHFTIERISANFTSAAE